MSGLNVSKIAFCVLLTGLFIIAVPTLVPAQTYEDLVLWEQFNNRFGPDLDPMFSRTGAIRKIVGSGAADTDFDFGNDAAVERRTQSMLQGLEHLMRKNALFPIQLIRINRTNNIASVEYREIISSDPGLSINPPNIGLVTIALNRAGSLVGFDSNYVQDIEFVNERYTANENLMRGLAQGMFLIKESSHLPVQNVQDLEYSPFVELENTNDYDRAFYYEARRYAVDYEGQHFEQKLAYDSCQPYYLSPPNYRKVVRSAQFDLIPREVQERVLGSMLKNSPPLPFNQKPLEQIFRESLLQMKNKPIGGSPFRFGEMSQFTEVNHSISYYPLGEEIHFNLLWNIKDFIRERLLGNEHICDCTFGVKIRLRIIGAGRTISLTVLPITVGDMTFGIPENCKLLQLALILAAIYNFVNPIVITPATELMRAQLKEPLIDRALDKIITNLANDAAADYGGSPRVKRFFFGSGGTRVNISWDSKRENFHPNPLQECWTTKPFPGTSGGAYRTNRSFYSDISGDGKADAIALVDLGPGRASVKTRKSTGLRFSSERIFPMNREFDVRRVKFFARIFDYRSSMIYLQDNAVLAYRWDLQGNMLEPLQILNSGFSGEISTAFADVTGDGLDDGIAVNSLGIVVRVVSPGAMGPPVRWTNGAFVGTRGTFFADVDGDHKSDAIVANAGGVFVRRSNGSSFGRLEVWSAEQIDADQTVFPGDFNGDGLADLLVVRLTATQTGPNFVIFSDGSEFVRNAQNWDYSLTPDLVVSDLDGDQKVEVIFATDYWTMILRPPYASNTIYASRERQSKKRNMHRHRSVIRPSK